MKTKVRQYYEGRFIKKLLFLTQNVCFPIRSVNRAQKECVHKISWDFMNALNMRIRLLKEK